MFEKILIANRGEIACRIIKTARRMNIATIAVYSEADIDAQHVRLADEAVFIGPAPAAQSYLNIEKIVSICKEKGVKAVHPGYGFLSEKQEFALALAKAGIAFIGPNPKAIYAMGDKIESKKLAEKAGVHIVPGFVGDIKDDKMAREIAHQIGYPVMVKASAGGGGKGMRIAFSDSDLVEGLRAAKSEAKSSFADDRVFIEKYIQKPRHIEIQILGDQHGHIIHLGERECSIQRRHQKVIEEAPSPIMDKSLRDAMGEQAISLAREVGYDSAGTVEFIMDQDRRFYFLEMNTRLQVEHPVTEMVTGIDLVEQMIRIAAGEKLKLQQSDVTFKGSAIEARIYAEDPTRNFLPSIGRLTCYREPQNIRIDSGIYEGSEISIYYDPMIAKAVAYAEERNEAASMLAEALDHFEIKGLQHNIGFLQTLLNHQKFLAGDISTDFIAEEFPEGFKGAILSEQRKVILSAILAVSHQIMAARAFTAQAAFTNGHSKQGGKWAVDLGEGWRKFDIVGSNGSWLVRSPTAEFTIETDWRPSKMLGLFHVKGEKPIAIQIERRGINYILRHQGAVYEGRVMNWRAAELAAMMPKKRQIDLGKYLLSPMPGLLSHLRVKIGDKVKVGQELCVIEAMKMENSLKADHECVIEKIEVEEGQSLSADQIIMEFS